MVGATKSNKKFKNEVKSDGNIEYDYDCDLMEVSSSHFHHENI